jgi:hypothetical protein
LELAQVEVLASAMGLVALEELVGLVCEWGLPDLHILGAGHMD